MRGRPEAAMAHQPAAATAHPWLRFSCQRHFTREPVAAGSACRATAAAGGGSSGGTRRAPSWRRRPYAWPQRHQEGEGRGEALARAWTPLALLLAPSCSAGGAPASSSVSLVQWRGTSSFSVLAKVCGMLWNEFLGIIKRACAMA